MPKRTYFPFKIGDIVQFKTAKNEMGFTEIQINKGEETTIIKSGQTKMTPPIMIVVEVVKELKTSSYKVRCIWYSQNTSKYQERWFNHNTLNLINHIKVKNRFKVNDSVSLKTKVYADEKVENIFKDTISGVLGNSDISYKITRIFDNLTFLPPIMLVLLPIEKVKPEKLLPEKDKKTGEKIRLQPLEMVKCIWYDQKTEKFSESFFPKESLIKIEEYDINKKIREVIDKK